MTSIDSTASLAALIRRQVSSLARRPGDGLSASRSSARAANATDKAAGGGPADIAALVARRVAAIDPDDPNRNPKAFRVFLESVLLAEFGDNLINDAGFHQLVEDVHSQMSGDPDLARAMQSATARMLDVTVRPRT